MIQEVTELVATWLADATWGVNALLPNVPRLVGDVAPDAIGAIYQEYAHDFLAQDKDPPIVPSLIVAVENDVQASLATGMPTSVITAADSVYIGVFYAVRQTLGAQAKRDGSYTLRAVRQSLHALGSQAGSSSRTLRETTLADIVRVSESRLTRTLGDGALAGMCVARCTVWDTAP